MTTGEVIALIKAFGGSGGGGSSGGGGLKVGVTVTESGDGTISTLDKTWKQISDAIENGIIPYVINGEDGDRLVYILSEIIEYEDGGVMHYGVVFGRSSNYETDSENGYPSASYGGGGGA